MGIQTRYIGCHPDEVSTWSEASLVTLATALCQSDTHWAAPDPAVMAYLIRKFKRHEIVMPDGRSAPVLRIDNPGSRLLKRGIEQNFMIWTFTESTHLWKSNVKLPTALIDHVLCEHFGAMDAIFIVLHPDLTQPRLLGVSGLAGGHPNDSQEHKVPTLYLSSAILDPEIRGHQASMLFFHQVDWRGSAFSRSATYYNVVLKTCSAPVFKLCDFLISQVTPEEWAALAPLSAPYISHAGIPSADIPEHHHTSVAWTQDLLGKVYDREQGLYVASASIASMDFNRGYRGEKSTLIDTLRQHGVSCDEQANPLGQTYLCVTVPRSNSFFTAMAQTLASTPALKGNIFELLKLLEAAL